MKSVFCKENQMSFKKFFYYLLFVLIVAALGGCSTYFEELKESVSNIEVSYTVEHYRQSVDAKTYEQETADTEILKGTSLSKTEAKSKNYEGFTAKKIEQKTINRDGSTVVKIYYNRNTITYTFESDGGEWDGSKDNKTTTGLYGANLIAPDNPSKTGYTFASWNQTVPQVFGSKDTTFTAKWAAGTGTLYKVEHLLQDAAGTSYVKIDEYEQSFTGTTGEQTVAKANNYEGFTAGEVIQQEIAADGSTVINISYNRNSITYTFNADGGKWNDGAASTLVSGLYGSEIPSPIVPVKTGYVFKQWGEAVPETFGSNNKSFTAVWAPATGTAYTVEHWQQNIYDDNYTIVAGDTQNLTGTTDSSTNASANTYSGFTAKTIAQDIIAPDGSTLVKIYYDRKDITYRFLGGGGNWNDGTGVQTVEGRFGSDVAIPVQPQLTGYTFTQWSSTIPQAFGAENSIFTAEWRANTDTAYSVEHWQQNIDDDEYTKIVTETKYGTTAVQTEAEEKTYIGFTVQSFLQSAISPDGSTIIRINYNRDVIDYIFNSTQGKFSDNTTSKTVSGKYGAVVNIPDAPERIGYNFGDWNSTIPQTFGAETITFEAGWTARTDTVYKVEHWQQNINDDDYTKFATETKQGTTAGQTSAAANTYEGFNSLGITQQEIAADGSTVVRIDYNRKNITYTFKPNGGNWNNNTSDKTISGKYGASVSISNPVRTGYTFGSWDKTVPSVFGTENVTFTTNWTPNTNTAYKVEHYKQNVSGDGYTIVSGDTQNLTGTTATQTNASAKSYTGFEVQTFTQAAIASEGNTVVKIYYNRKTITYTFNPNGGNWNGSTSNKTISGRYGATVSISNPVRTGYTFGSWDKTVPSVFGTENATFATNWTPNTNTAYKVEHYKQNVSGDGYTIVSEDTQNLTGTTATQTNASAKTYTGFEAQPFTQTTIAPEGNTIVRINYNRKTITYTFNPNGGNWNGSTSNKTISGRYGATVTKPADPTRTGYTFDSWNSNIPSVFGASNATYKTNWTPNTNTAYKVEHYKQNINDDGYTIVSGATQNLTGTTATQTNASAKTYTGFEVQPFTQAAIAPEGNTVVKIYYNRKTITYTFNPNGGNWGGSTSNLEISGKYGASVNLPANPSSNHPRYMFDTWDDTIPSKFGLNNATFSAQYKYNFYETPEILSALSFGTAGFGYTYVYFGVYPQSKKTEDVIIDETVSITMGGNRYYLGSDMDYYIKIVEKAATDNVAYDDDSPVSQYDEENPKYEYFRLEPIKWRVLTRDYNETGKALLFAEKILFHHNYSNLLENNNYKKSRIRSYINDTFLNTAFTTKAKNDIEVTEVDNSERSTNPDSNPTQYNEGINQYYCVNTWDKIFLLSIQELTKTDYLLTQSVCILHTRTDYAKASGTSNAGWWLRSPYYNGSGSVVIVSAGTLTTSTIILNSMGVIPALTIALP